SRRTPAFAPGRWRWPWAAGRSGYRCRYRRRFGAMTKPLSLGLSPVSAFRRALRGQIAERHPDLALVWRLVGAERRHFRAKEGQDRAAARRTRGQDAADFVALRGPRDRGREPFAIALADQLFWRGAGGMTIDEEGKIGGQAPVEEKGEREM